MIGTQLNLNKLLLWLHLFMGLAFFELRLASTCSTNEESLSYNLEAEIKELLHVIDFINRRAMVVDTDLICFFFAFKSFHK